MLTAQTQSNEDVENMLLLKRCRANDADACNALMELYNRKIFNTAYRILGEQSRAEDALQETLINVYRGLSNFRGESKISTWISRITVNVCLGMLRKGKRHQSVALEDDLIYTLESETTPYTDPLEHASLEEIRALIAETFSIMSEKQSVVVRLHDMEGYTIQEIADIIECPVGTVKSRLFYGRQEFKDVFTSLAGGEQYSQTIQ
jgi:RNA polymerase sigma-70 factor (ECF subfamily)